MDNQITITQNLHKNQIKNFIGKDDNLIDYTAKSFFPDIKKLEQTLTPEYERYLMGFDITAPKVILTDEPESDCDCMSSIGVIGDLLDFIEGLNTIKFSAINNLNKNQ